MCFGTSNNSNQTQPLRDPNAPLPEVTPIPEYTGSRMRDLGSKDPKNTDNVRM